MIQFAILVIVVVVDPADCLAQVFLVQIASSDHLALFDFQKLLGVARPLHAPADHAQGNAF